MNSSGKKRVLCVWMSLAPVVCALGGFATPVDAQTAVSLAASRSNSVAAAAMPGTPAVAAAELARRVKTALHAAPYFYDEHVTVSVEQGDVVLRGFVLSSLDLQDAIRIARKAAGDSRVVDNLAIELNGQSGRH
jgi:osmotically-inducible protein OsmY